jgi:hypothetical protein
MHLRISPQTDTPHMNEPPIAVCYIAAIAIAGARAFAVATRDVAPFEAAGLTVINPWLTTPQPARLTLDSRHIQILKTPRNQALPPSALKPLRIP